jgi:hypothetical protein
MSYYVKSYKREKKKSLAVKGQLCSMYAFISISQKPLFSVFLAHLSQNDRASFCDRFSSAVRANILGLGAI